MTILLTGANGFLGHIIRTSLYNDDIISLGRKRSDITCDLSEEIPNLPNVGMIIHCAGKAHTVPKTDEEREEFYKVNVEGTRKLLMAIQNASELPRSFVFISSIAVYGAQAGQLIDEEMPLKATDPYGNSKIIAERLIQDWCEKNGIICTILRLPLIAGPNPPGNLLAMIKGIKKGYYLNVSGGNARKSIVMAEDVARIIPKAAAIGGIYNLTDGQHPSFYELSKAIAVQLNKPTPFNIPSWSALMMGKIGDVIGKKSPINTDKLKKMTSDLTFDDSRAIQVLGWHPQKVLDAFKIN